jgi:hypothetical protein
MHGVSEPVRPALQLYAPTTLSTSTTMPTSLIEDPISMTHPGQWVRVAPSAPLPAPPANDPGNPNELTSRINGAPVNR